MVGSWLRTIRTCTLIVRPWNISTAHTIIAKYAQEFHSVVFLQLRKTLQSSFLKEKHTEYAYVTD